MCSSLNSITIPNSVEKIEFAAFYNCSSLSSVTIRQCDKYRNFNVIFNCLVV